MARQLTRLSPFSDLARFDPLRMDPFRNFEEAMREFSLMPSLRGFEAEPSIRLDVQESDQTYDIQADIPGVSIEGNQVTIRAQTAEEKEEKQEGKLVRRERYAGEQYRSFSLPQDIDDKGAEARYENGVLSLSLPKRAGGASKALAIK
jgi:HSP20 family protein